LGKLLAVMMSAETLLGGGANLLTGFLFDATGSYQSAFKAMAVCSIVSVILMALLLPRGLVGGKLKWRRLAVLLCNQKT
jgi:cyanate permease